MNPNSKIRFQKALYLVPLSFALIFAWVFLLNWPFDHQNDVLFHINTFAVTVHHIFDLAITIILIWVFDKSRKNCLIAFDVKHSTVIARK